MEAEINFEKENINGIAVVGTYLIDAAQRLGVRIADESGRLGLDDSTAVTVKSGAEFLSVPTKAEIEVLSNERRAGGERLADQTKITGEGAIVIATKDKPATPEVESNEQYRKEFAELPLEKKVSNLLELEAITLGETFNFILNSPRAVVGKVMDVMAEFGFKLDAEAKEAKKPEEHKQETTENGRAKKTAKKSKKTEKAEETVEAETHGENPGMPDEIISG